MRVRICESIYFVKKVESNDIQITFCTFTGETIVLIIPKGEEQGKIMDFLSKNGYVDLSEFDTDAIRIYSLDTSF